MPRANPQEEMAQWLSAKRRSSELRTCGLAVPTNSAEIADALRAIRDGATDTLLPQPQ